MKYFDRIFRRAAERRGLADLMRLDDHLLRDIGVTRAEVEAMMSRRRHRRGNMHD